MEKAWLQLYGYVGRITSKEYDTYKEDTSYTVNSIVGKLGLEQTFETYLSGTSGKKRIEVDEEGNVSNETILEEAISGNNITTTIDYRLQVISENALQKVMKEIQNGENDFNKAEDAKSGAVVVLDVKTGQVLSLVSYPSFDPNVLSNSLTTPVWNSIINSTDNVLLNRAIAGTYSPGSTFKMLVATAALSEKKITKEELINDPGIYPYSYNPKCWIYEKYGFTHGNINVETAIAVSCNCYFYEVGRRIGIDCIIKYAKMFGLRRKNRN